MDTPPPIPPPPVPASSPALKPGPLLIIGTTLLVLLNMWLGFAKTMHLTGDFPRALGYATGQFVMPVIVSLLFSISKRFRNARSRTTIVFWTSVLIFLSALANAGRA